MFDKLYPLVCKHAKIMVQRWYGQGSQITGTSGCDAYMWGYSVLVMRDTRDVQ